MKDEKRTRKEQLRSKELAQQVLNLDLSRELTAEQVDTLFPPLNAFNQIVYDFVIKYHKYLFRSRSYFEKYTFTMVEVHVLQDIGNAPGITAGELAVKWDRTAASMSQIIRKLEGQGLLSREADEKDRKYFHLFLTPAGREVDDAHRRFDIRSIIGTNQKLLEQFTVEEILSCRDVLAAYGELIDQEK